MWETGKGKMAERRVREVRVALHLVRRLYEFGLLYVDCAWLKGCPDGLAATTWDGVRCS